MGPVRKPISQIIWVLWLWNTCWQMHLHKHSLTIKGMFSNITGPILPSFCLKKKREAVEVLFPFKFELMKKADLVFLI